MPPTPRRSPLRRPPETPDRAAQIYEQIRRGADDYHRGVVSHQEFSRRQRAVWDWAQAAGPAVFQGVLRRVRESLPAPVPGGLGPASGRALEREIAGVVRRSGR